MNLTWYLINQRPCQSYTHPIWTWYIPPPYLGYDISEPWIVTVRRILQGGHLSRPSGIGPHSPETPSAQSYRIRPPRTDPEIS